MTATIPRGFRFEPTDEELICYYLYPKIMDLPLEWNCIAEKELYGDNAEPSVIFSDIHDSSPYWNTKEEGGATKRTIYVFTKVTKTSPNSKRNSRRAGSGTWTGQTGPKNVIGSQDGAVIGCTRMLTYQHSKKGSNDPNHWIMHEYSLIEAGAAAIGERKNDVVLCKITKFVKKSERHRMLMQQQVQPPQSCFSPLAASVIGAAASNKRKAEGEGGEESDFAKRQRVLMGSFEEWENAQKMPEIDLMEKSTEMADVDDMVDIAALFSSGGEVTEDNGQEMPELEIPSMSEKMIPPQEEEVKESFWGDSPEILTDEDFRWMAELEESIREDERIGRGGGGGGDGEYHHTN